MEEPKPLSDSSSSSTPPAEAVVATAGIFFGLGELYGQGFHEAYPQD